MIRYRLAAVCSGLLLLSACAQTTPIQIVPRLDADTVLTYQFDSEVSTTIDEIPPRRVEATLSGRVTLSVLDVTEDGIRMRVRVEPTASSRDGIQTSPGGPQERVVLLLSEGGVVSDPGPGGTIGDADLDPDAIATLLRPEVPDGLLSPAASWRSDDVEGHVVEVLKRDGQDLVRLALQRQREVTLVRTMEGRPIDLNGIETSVSDLYWNLGSGVPWAATVETSAHLDVRAGAQQAGVIKVEAMTRIQKV